MRTENLYGKLKNCTILLEPVRSLQWLTQKTRYLKMYYTKTFSFFGFFIFLKKFILWQSVKKKDLMSKYLLKADSRAAH